MKDRNYINALNLCESCFNRKLLLEEYHISEIFDECANDIIKNFIPSKKFKYTGWVFNSKDKKCIKTDNKLAGHPIYIRKKEDLTNRNILGIDDRQDKNISNTDGIYISINRENYSPFDLDHEFSHALDMYITNKNLIKSESTKSVLDKEDIDKILLDEAKYYNYLLFKSEQRAFNKATIRFLKNFKNSKEYENIIKENSELFRVIYELIDKSSRFNKYEEIKKIYRDLNIYYNIERYDILCVLYFLYMESKDKHIDLKILNTNQQETAQKMLNIFNNIKNEYFNDLYKLIYHHILFDFNK